MEFREIPLSVRREILDVAEYLDKVGYLFMQKSTVSFTPTQSKPPDLGSEFLDSLRERCTPEGIRNFVHQASNQLNLVKQKSYNSSKVSELDVKLESIVSFSEFWALTSSEADAKFSSFPQSESAESKAEYISKMTITYDRISNLAKKLGEYKPEEDWQEGDNELPIPLSREELEVVLHGLALSEGSLKLPQWSAGTRQTIRGVIAILEELGPVIRPISKPLFKAWNLAIEGLRLALGEVKVKLSELDEDS
jgi:hypothetical protein